MDHRTRNRANKPPSEQQLLDAARYQLWDAARADTDPKCDGPQEDAEDEEESVESYETRTRARRHKPKDPDPKTAAYYPSCWRESIDRAKEKFRRFTMLYNLFPGRDNHLQDAARILSKIVAEEKSDGKRFHPG